MKRVILLSSLCLLVVSLGAVGCNNGKLNILQPRDKTPITTNEVPPVPNLVHYMDNNAKLVKSLRCMDVNLTVQKGIVPINAPGRMVCQQPRDFRMSARHPIQRSDEVDIGSNDQEFWFWIKQAEPPQGLKVAPQFHCSYQAMQEGKVKYLPFPFQPEWIMETLGMGQYGPASRYEPQAVVDQQSERIKLIEHTKSPQGQAVRKVIVFNRRKVTGTQPQITDYLLEEEGTGKVICSAHILETQFDKNGAVLPRRLELRWPEQKLKLGMELNGVEINPQFNPGMFVRQPMNGIPSMDLATGHIDGQPSSIQRAQGLQPMMR
jgi:hypothetical protein